MRIDNWEMVYATFLQSELSRPFVWGQNDCATFAFGMRAVLTGVDDRLRWAGQYHSEAGAMRTCRRLGWRDFEAMGRTLLGEPLPFVLLGQRGDIVLGGDPLGWAVVIGAQCVGLSPAGPITQPLEKMRLAWRVE